MEVINMGKLSYFFSFFRKPKNPFKDGVPCDCPDCMSRFPCPLCGRLRAIPVEKYDFRDEDGNKYEWRGEIRWPEVETISGPGEMYFSSTGKVVESSWDWGKEDGFVAMIMYRVPNNG
jgi:hypothetical protein